jgi:hypothetical protein
MKLKTIVAACALACTSQAYALAPTATQDVTLFVSGSSALQTMLGQTAGSIIENMDVYFDGTTAAPATGKNYRAYFGTAKPSAFALYPSLETAPGSGIGKNVIIYETALGGSTQGVYPVAGSAFGTVSRLSMANCGAVSIGTDTTTARPLWNCNTGTAGTTVVAVPQAGISDVEPATLAAGINGGTGSVPAGLLSSGVLGVVMGVTTTTGSPFTNLTKAQVTGLMGGNIADWSTIDAVATGKSVIVCRRVAGSGTQASINASFFGAPCSTGALPPSTYLATTAPLGSSTAVAAGNVVVVENSSSGNVKTCMAAAKLGTAAGAFTGALGAINVKNGNLVAAGSANSVVLPVGGYGIGVLGLDGGTTANYQFASIDGVAATTANASTGAYDVMVEATFNDMGTVTGAQGDVYALFKQYAGDPAILGVAGAGGTPVPGVAALSENGWPVATPFDPAMPVLRVGNFGNTCQPLSTLQ